MPASTIAQLERAYLKAHREEQKAIAALPEKPSKAMTDRCWALADATNRAREALTAARDEEQRKDSSRQADLVDDVNRK